MASAVPVAAKLAAVSAVVSAVVSAAVLAAVALARPLVAAELESASILIEFSETAAHVEAVYRVAGTEAVEFRLRRFPGQTVRFLSTPNGLRESPGAFSFAAAPGGGEVAVRYEVGGAHRRVPLFVPAAPATGALEIRLRGAATGLALRDGFPRLQSVEGGALVARPAHLPSFVRLPPPRGSLNVHRVAESAVVLLVVLATAVWIVRRKSLRSPLSPRREPP